MKYITGNVIDIYHAGVEAHSTEKSSINRLSTHDFVWQMDKIVALFILGSRTRTTNLVFINE